MRRCNATPRESGRHAARHAWRIDDARRCVAHRWRNEVISKRALLSFRRHQRHARTIVPLRIAFRAARRVM